MNRHPSCLKGMCGSPRHKFCIASLDNALLIDGFVFAPPDRSILIQPSEMTRFASIPNWLCLATFRFPVLLSGNVRIRLCHRLAAVACCAATQAHPVLVIRPSSAQPPPSATRHSSGGTRWTRVVEFPGLSVPFRAILGHPIQRGPSFYCGKKDRHQRVTTKHTARPSRKRLTYEPVGCVELAMTHRSASRCVFATHPTCYNFRVRQALGNLRHASKILNVSRSEGHGKAGLIRILFSVCVGEFRGWSLIPWDPRLDVAGRNRLSGFVRVLVAAVIVCVPASGIASPQCRGLDDPELGLFCIKKPESIRH